MWILGVSLTVAVSVVIAFALMRFKEEREITLMWDIPRTAGTYTTIVGTLAGFSVTSAIFVANLSVVRDSPEFEGVMGMFLLAFIAFMGTAMQFGATPNLANNDESYVLVQRYAYMFANLGYYHGIALSWLALRLLLLAIGLDYLANIFTVVLFVTVLAGAFRVVQFNLHLTTQSSIACLAMPLLAFGCAGIYRAGIVSLAGDLWPEDNAPLMLALVCFASATAGFFLQSLLLAGSARGFTATFLQRSVQILLMLYSQGAATTIALLWMAVATA
jgi:hypothetical protein